MLPSALLNGVGTPNTNISQLNTQPAGAPVNASMAALRLTMHDSGSGWFAKPSLYDSFIHYPTPVYPGALNKFLVHNHKPYRLVAFPTATGWKAAVYKIEGGQTNDCYRPDQIFKTAKEAQAEAVIWTEGVSHERIVNPVWRDSI